MSQFFLLILAVVLPTGEVQVSHTFVSKCPTQEEVVAIMKPMKEKGEIIAWGGNCTSMLPKQDV